MNTTPDDVQRAFRRGYADVEWVEGAELHDVNGSPWVVRVPGERRCYAPSERSEIPNHFAKLADPAVDVLPFIRTYGLLGRAEMHSWREGMTVSGLEYRLPDALWELQKLHEKGELEARGVWADAEPVDWIRAHAGTVAWLLNVGQMLQHTSPRRRVADWRKARGSAPELVGIRPTLSSDWKRLTEEWYEDEPELEVTGNVLFVMVLNENLAGLRRAVMMVDGELRSVWGGASLLDSIYLLTLEAITGRSRLAQCQACGAVFVKTDERQKYCPPRAGQEKSTCMNRLRVARYREKQRTATKSIRQPRKGRRA